MGIQLEDGKGSGKSVQVDSSNRLTVASVSQSKIGSRSDDGQSYGINVPLRTQTTTGGKQLYIKNTSSSLNFHILDIFVYYDGGATNFTRPMEVELYFGDAAPSANNTTGGAGNLNRTSSNTADMDVEYWDEVGDGMTITGGTLALSGVVGQGQSRLSVDGAIVLGKNDTVSFNFKATEIGEAGMNILGYYE